MENRKNIMKNKVYVVTAGCYSDYRIVRIFFDKNKAEKYAEGLYDINEVEEWNVDDFECDKYVRISLSMDFDKKFILKTNSLNKPNFTVSKVNEIDHLSNAYDFGEKVTKYSFQKEIEYCILVVRTYYRDLNDKQIEKQKSKLEKYVLDLRNQIQHLVECENWTEKMINEWLKSKYKRRNTKKL